MWCSFAWPMPGNEGSRQRNVCKRCALTLAMQHFDHLLFHSAHTFVHGAGNVWHRLSCILFIMAEREGGQQHLQPCSEHQSARVLHFVVAGSRNAEALETDIHADTSWLLLLLVQHLRSFCHGSTGGSALVGPQACKSVFHQQILFFFQDRPLLYFHACWQY